MNNLGTKTLESDRLILRKFELKDVESVYNGYINQSEFLYYAHKETKSLDEIKDYIENKILTFYSMFAKKEYGEIDDLNWDLIEENVIDLNGTLDTVILDMSEIEISNEDIIAFKDGVNRLSIATSNKDINTVLEEYRLLYSTLPSYARKSF